MPFPIVVFRISQWFNGRRAQGFAHLSERVAHSLELSSVLRSRLLSSQDVLTVDSPSSGGCHAKVDAMGLKAPGAGIKNHSLQLRLLRLHVRLGRCHAGIVVGRHQCLGSSQAFSDRLVALFVGFCTRDLDVLLGNVHK